MSRRSQLLLPPVLADVAPRRREALESRSRALLTSLRWPGGPECPRCGENVRLSYLESRERWQCSGCRYQFSVTAGTIFHGSHLPLWKWLVAVHLLVDTPAGTSASELHRVLPCSYKTAWFAAHRIRAAVGARRRSVTAAGVTARQRLAPPYIHASERYRRAYLDEERWRAANRGNRQAFRDTLLALLAADGLSYRHLVGA